MFKFQPGQLGVGLLALMMTACVAPPPVLPLAEATAQSAGTAPAPAPAPAPPARNLSDDCHKEATAALPPVSDPSRSLYFVQATYPPVLEAPVAPPPKKGGAPAIAQPPVLKTRREDGMAVALGAGPEGCRLLTAAHVVTGARSVRLKTWSAIEGHASPETEAIVQWIDGAMDLAMLTAQGLEKCDDVQIAPVPKVAEEIYLFGQAAHNRGAISRGVVSGIWMLEAGATIISDALVIPGFSGGGAFDSRGALLGIILERSRDARPLAFVLPICRAVERLSTPASSVPLLADPAPAAPAPAPIKEH